MPRIREEISAIMARMQVENPSGCWDWPGYIHSYGYGMKYVDGKVQPSHRLAYIVAKGPIPTGLDIDHLCLNKKCFNPAHLEAVTRSENSRRRHVSEAKTHCPRGHEYAGENLRIIRKGRNDNRTARFCNECCRIRNREAQWAKSRAQGKPQRKSKYHP